VIASCLGSAVAVLLVLAQRELRAQQPAPQFNITPTRLFIPRGQTSASLVLRNEGAEPLRFQISAFGWSNDEEGHLQLHPTRDVVFFPVLFGVDPGQTRRVRVAVTERAVERELSYRLFVEQLPSRADARPAGVQMLMRASIPLFVQPPQLIARATIDRVEVKGGQLSFVVHSVGTVHVSIAKVVVTASSSPSYQSELPGWYLLSGESRTYRVALPATVCRDQATVRIAATFADNPTPLAVDQPVGAGDCAP
jgi:fimbrial chaperone protein